MARYAVYASKRSGNKFKEQHADEIEAKNAVLAFEQFMQRYGVTHSECVYYGDDKWITPKTMYRVEEVTA